MKFDSLVIHGGIDGDKATGAVSVPIYQVSTYAQSRPGEHHGFEYSRTKNPTRLALEKLVADLESGFAGFAFSSGMAAISSVFMLFSSGDHIILGDDVYGGSFRVANRIFTRLGLEFDYVDTSDLQAVKAGVRTNTKAIFLETPSNPLMKLTDITGVAEIAKKNQLLLIVDNTFMTPYLQRPLTLGADIVVHSATKYLGGHSDLVAGITVTNSPELAEKIHFVQNSTGAILGPQDSWLAIRGIKTLSLRMERHCLNAQRISEWLQEQDWVEKVYYPGFDPKIHSFARQMLGYGGMLSFQVRSIELVDTLLSGLRTITLAESLGGVESLISVPSRMTHASLPPEKRERLGITDTLVRLSVGIEDVEDIIGDLEPKS